MTIDIWRPVCASLPLRGIIIELAPCRFGTTREIAVAPNINVCSPMKRPGAVSDIDRWIYRRIRRSRDTGAANTGESAGATWAAALPSSAAAAISVDCALVATSAMTLTAATALDATAAVASANATRAAIPGESAGGQALG
eukprot:CAMPEP_0170592862 /NCGR_PEP_ID=MMETSP0224-20130122/13145_1 /TAXON_ID=285029 /ORGANISM="Togula jolla, Strain CCCM 725" /LENGTH=140 /DNA_ID=CAMNT_0010916785 /DNA_START=1457 /DNA_END=1876 /DNA_ORIENTATION=+